MTVPTHNMPSAMAVETEPVQEAVVGLALDTEGRYVLTVRKKRPDWQAGRFNGPGGKVEPGETHLQAMVREFYEETSTRTLESDWTLFIELTTPGWRVLFYRAFLPIEVLDQAWPGPDTDEELHLIPVEDITKFNTMRNLKWMVPLCLDSSPYVLPFRIQES